MQKSEYLEKEKSFLGEKKALSKVFQGLSFSEKIKNSRHKLQNKIHVIKKKKKSKLQKHKKFLHYTFRKKKRR